MSKIAILLLFFFVNFAFAVQPTYISLKPQFSSFLSKGRNADFETRLELWKSEIESALPDVYLNLLSSNSGTSVDQKRRALAEKWFGFYFANADRILAQYDNFEKLGAPIAKRLVQTYSEVDFSDVRVVAMPSLMMFNGQVRPVNGHAVAMFGMDFLELVDQNPKLIDGLDLINNMSVLVSHEFSHVLHEKLSKFEESPEIPGLELFVPLWQEGLAQMSSQMLVPGTDLTTTLMEHNLAAKCTRDQTVQWANIFLKDIQEGRDNLDKSYQRWFLINGMKEMGVARAGYCLGYHAVLSAMQEHSLSQLLKMDKQTMSLLLNKIVKEISQSN